MAKTLASIALVVLLSPLTGYGEDGRATLDAVARALGAGGLRSVQITGSGANFAVGQNYTPEAPWPRFNVKSFTRMVNYDTASLRDDLVRTQAENPPRGGGLQPIRGEQRQSLVVSGDHAWTVTGGTTVAAPIALVDRQFQLWATPHGVIKAAIAHNAIVVGRMIAFTIPGRFTATATVDERNLVERVDAVLAHPVLGDAPVTVLYADYQDVEGVKFPTKIRQTVAGFPALDVVIGEIRPNAPVDIAVPDGIRQTVNPYARVTSQKVADGVWYVTGGTHHSAVIEMKDHVVVVESPLNDERAMAVIMEARALVPKKPIRYVINTHHHFDHSGGLRAFASVGVPVITHETNRAFLERALAAPATVSPDYLAKSGRKGIVESVRDRRLMSDGTRTLELHHLTGNMHHDGLLMVYLPNEKLLIEADAYTPPPPDAPPPSPANQPTVNLADNLKRLGLGVDQILPLHGRMVPLAELARAAGHEH
jgi:glyoxylase-like metal-dependent hydrolase (beta-lactamase superfamily II)